MGKQLVRLMPAAGLLWVLAGGTAHADAGKVDTGDTAFMLICSALVLFMTPGLAFWLFFAIKDDPNVLQLCLAAMCALFMLAINWIVRRG